MSRRVQLLPVLLILVALVVSGCGTPQRAVEKAVEEAVSEVAEEVVSEAKPTSSKGGKGEATAPEPTPTPQEEPAQEEAIDPEEVAAFDQLDSYRMVQVMEWRSEDEDGTEEGSMRLEVAYVREPRAMHWRMTVAEGSDAEESSLEMIWADGNTYMNFGDEWMAMTSEDEAESPWAYSPGDYITSDSERVGTETVNGYRSIHYRARETEAILGAGQLTQGDYWVSTEHDVVVRGIASWVISGVEGQSGQWKLQWDITDINEPITIVAPEGVAKPGLPEDVPLMAGASNVSSMMGITSFEIDATAAEVTEFYMDALEANGWTFESSLMETMHSFSKAGRSLTLMIDEESTPTSVTIMIDEE